MKFPTRIVVHTKDAMLIAGISERTACRLLVRIRRANNKKRNTLVTIDEFCSYTGLTKEQVMPFL